jgi:hypothetical protein
MLDELKASRASCKRAWEILQEIRWVLKDVAGLELPPPARKTIDLEGRVNSPSNLFSTIVKAG